MYYLMIKEGRFVRLLDYLIKNALLMSTVNSLISSGCCRVVISLKKKAQGSCG